MTAYQWGEVTSCCFAPDVPLGNLRASTLAQIWNDAPMRKLRLNMLKDEPSAQCWRCYERESIGGYSRRVDFNQDFAHHLPFVTTTLPDGSVPRMNMVYLDFRFSNVCNFSCRTCDPSTSSAWYDDGIKLSGQANPATRIVRAIDDPHETWRQLEPLLDDVEVVYFAGGEPLITDEHYRVLTHLIETKRTHVHLRYSTNFSTLTYKSFDVMALWRKFENVQVQASIDGTEERGEYIRKGQIWEQVLVNRERLEHLCPHVGFDLSATVLILNALHMPDLHRECVALGLIRPHQLGLNILFDPHHLRLQVLPSELKEEMRARYRNHIDNYIKPLGEHADGMQEKFEAVLHFLNEQDMSNKLPEFQDMTRRLDAIRGESLATAIPELATLLVS